MTSEKSNTRLYTSEGTEGGAEGFRHGSQQNAFDRVDIRGRRDGRKDARTRLVGNGSGPVAKPIAGSPPLQR